MNLRKYVEEHGREGIASALDTSPAYVYQLANGHRRVTAEMAARIELATGKKVTRHDLRPDIYPKESARVS